MTAEANDRATTEPPANATLADRGMSATQAAASLGVNERTVRRAIERGDLAATKATGVFRITPAALAAYRSRLEQSPSDHPRPESLTRSRQYSSAQAAASVNFERPERTAPPLPIPPNALVGRDDEAAVAVALLHRDEVRILTLTGPGGVGKTRLALRVAAEMTGDYPGGVWLVPLATVTEPGLVLPRIAQVLGIRLREDHSAVEQIGRWCHSQRMLLVLDNFEQIVEASVDVAELLELAPGLNVVVTSREVLNLAGEYQLAVPPLTTPDPTRMLPFAEMANIPAVRLFVARAQAAAGFSLNDSNAVAVAAICQRLDGLPLAIELAATRIRLFPPLALLAQLGQRLPMLTGGARDAPARHRTMRDAIAWSHDLLTQPEQAIFRRLAVFSGGFTLEGAEAISRAVEQSSSRDVTPLLDSSTPRLLDSVASLLDKNLIVQSGGRVELPRFTMLETIREFASEQFGGCPEEPTVRRAHAGWYLDHAEQIEAHWQGFDHAGSLADLETEHGNLRAALLFFEEAEDAVHLLRLAVALSSFWYHAGHLGEGLDWLGRAVALGRRRDAPSHHLAMAISWMGRLTTFGGDPARARALLEEALALRRATGNREGIAHTQAHLGRLAIAAGNLVDATAYLADAHDHFRALDHAAGRSMVLDAQSEVAFRQGDDTQADALATAAVAAGRDAGNALRVAAGLIGLAQVAVKRRNGQRAVAYLDESLILSHDIGFRFGMADALIGFAAIANQAGRKVQAARLLAAATAIRDALTSDHLFHEAQFLRTHADVQARLDPDTYTRAWAAGLALSLPEACAEARAVMIDPGSALTLPEPIGIGLTPREREVLRLLGEGHSNQGIADALFISQPTVKSHVTRILTKLNVSTRTEAVSHAHRLGLL